MLLACLDNLSLVSARDDRSAGFAAGDQGGGKQDDGGDRPHRDVLARRIGRWDQDRHDGARQQPAVQQKTEEEGSRCAGVPTAGPKGNEGEDGARDEYQRNQSAGDSELKPAWMAAHAKDDGRPAGRHNGGPEAEGNDQGAIAGERPAVARDRGAAEQRGQQPDPDTATNADQRGPRGETPILLTNVGWSCRHSGHPTEQGICPIAIGTWN